MNTPPEPELVIKIQLIDVVAVHRLRGCCNSERHECKQKCHRNAVLECANRRLGDDDDGRQ